MNNEQIIQFEVESSKSPLNFRIISGILLGVLVGALLNGTIDRGFYIQYFPIHKEWDSFSWNNWFVRSFGCIISSIGGAFISGLIARKKGKVVGLLSTIPSIFFWFYYLYGQLQGNLNLGFTTIDITSNSTSMIMPFVLILLNLIGGYLGGQSGEESSNVYNLLFDKKKYSLLGIKWYHYLWFPFFTYFVLTQSFAVLFFMIDKFLFFWTSSARGMKFLIPSILGVIISISIVFYYTSLIISYKILSGITAIDYNKNKFQNYFKPFFAFPVLAIVVQYGVYYLEYYFYNLFN